MTTMKADPNAKTQPIKIQSTQKPTTHQPDQAFIDKYGPWALVSGASAGIGEEFAKQLAAKGLNLVLVARREQRLEELANRLRIEFGISIRVVPVDLTGPKYLETIDLATHDIQIGLVINNAGMENHGPFAGQDLELETKLLQLNVIAPMQIAHHFSAKMQRRQRGGILFVSSAAGYGAWPFLANYAASKAYVLTFGESLHYELAKYGIDVTVLSPGLTDTEMAGQLGRSLDFKKIPMKTMRPDEVVRTGLKSLGRKPSVIPGIWNNILGFLNKRFMSRRGGMKMFGRLMDKASYQPLV